MASNPEGYVDIALLCIFSRVQALLKSSHRDAASVPEQTVADVADALEAAESLALSDDRKRVRRATALKQSDEVGCRRLMQHSSGRPQQQHAAFRPPANAASAGLAPPACLTSCARTRPARNRLPARHFPQLCLNPLALPPRSHPLPAAFPPGGTRGGRALPVRGALPL